MKKNSFLDLLVFSYVVFIVVWFASRLLFFDQFWPLALLNTLGHYLFLPLLFLLVICLWARRQTLLWSLSIPTLLFIYLFGGLFLPTWSTSAAADTGQSLTVMSFNVLHRNKEHPAIIDAIRTTSPDLVGFQELIPNQGDSILKALEADYPYNTFEWLIDGTAVALLSRYPIEQAEKISLPPRHLAMRARLKIDDQAVHVFVVHLSPSQFLEHPLSEFVSLVKERYGRRAAETMRLQQTITTLNDPVLLICDCNLTDLSEAYANLDAVLDDSFREVGWGFGHTLHPPGFPFPLQRIDYVWHSTHFAAKRAYVGPRGASDHWSMVAELQIK